MALTNSSDIIRRLKKDGWVLARTKGDHHIFKHEKRHGLIVIPHPRKDLPKGTVMSIYKAAGWARD